MTGHGVRKLILILILLYIGRSEAGRSSNLHDRMRLLENVVLRVRIWRKKDEVIRKSRVLHNWELYNESAA